MIEFDLFPSVLSIFMAGMMNDAVDDLTADGSKPPADLYERFLSWTHPTRNPHPGN